MDITTRIRNIKLLVSDVDGVLTDGTVIYSDNQAESKAFNVKDGLGIKLAGWCGIAVLLLTGRTSPVVSRRAAELGVPVIQGANNKENSLRQIASEAGVSLDAIAYIGDDINDIPAMRIAGFPIAVADAAPEVISLARYTTSLPGGRGAVREAIEYILRGQGRWEEALEIFLQKLPATSL